MTRSGARYLEGQPWRREFFSVRHQLCGEGWTLTVDRSCTDGIAKHTHNTNTIQYNTGTNTKHVNVCHCKSQVQNKHKIPPGTQQSAHTLYKYKYTADVIAKLTHNPSIRSCPRHPIAAQNTLFFLNKYNVWCAQTWKHMCGTLYTMCTQT